MPAMLYCPTCQDLYEDAARCPRCDSRHMRPVEPTDPVFLGAIPSPRAQFLIPMLEDAGIPFTQVGSRAAWYGMNTVGWRMDVLRFYVPYEKLQEAGDMVLMLENSFTNEAADDEAEEYESEE